MADFILRIRAGICNGEGGLRICEVIRHDDHFGLARIVFLILVGDDRGRNDFIAAHIEAAHAVIGVVALEILALHHLSDFDGLVIRQNIRHFHGVDADFLKDRSHGHIPGDGGVRGNLIACRVLPSGEGLACRRRGLRQGEGLATFDVLGGNLFAAGIEVYLIIGSARQPRGIKGYAQGRRRQHLEHQHQRQHDCQEPLFIRHSLFLLAVLRFNLDECSSARLRFPTAGWLVFSLRRKLPVSSRSSGFQCWLRRSSCPPWPRARFRSRCPGRTPTGRRARRSPRSSPACW